MIDSTSCDESECNEPPPAMCAPTSPVQNPTIPPCHFYVDVSDVNDSTHETIGRHVFIDHDFQSNLEQEQEGGDFSTFLALPEIVLARKRKRQQPLLDFTKSKILTSRAYSEGCERVMAQREATQTEVKRKAAEREANKETRRKEKEELVEQVRIRKEERATKKLQREQAEAERQACCGGRWVGVSAGAGEEPAATKDHDAGAAAVQRGTVATDGAAYSPQSAGASPPHERNNDAPPSEPTPHFPPPSVFTGNGVHCVDTTVSWISKFSIPIQSHYGHATHSSSSNEIHTQR